MHHRILYVLVALLPIIRACVASKSTCDSYTSPALSAGMLRSPWSVASGSNEWLSTIVYDPALVEITDNELILNCELDANSNATVGLNNSTYLAGSVTTDSALEYGFIDLRLQTSSNFWETVLQCYQSNDDDSFDYIVVGIAPTYIYVSVGVNVGSSNPVLLDLSISLQPIFGSSFDTSLAFHNYSLLRTATNCAVYIDGTYVGGFSRADLLGSWPFLADDGEVPIYVMQSNLNSRAGDNATALITDLSATSIRCYEIEVGRVNDLDVVFPFGTVDLVLQSQDPTESLAMIFNTIQLLNATTLNTIHSYMLPVSPRQWNQSSGCDRQAPTCFYKFVVPIESYVITVTYTIYQDEMTISLGNADVRVRSGDFRLDLDVLPPLKTPGTVFRLGAVLASTTQLRSNYSTANSTSMLNLQAGRIAMNLSFYEWSPQLNASSMARAGISKTSNISSSLTVDFSSSQQLTAFLRVAYSEHHRRRFRWWMAVVGGLGILLLLGVCGVLTVVIARRLRKCLRRRRRREIEMRAAKVVTA